MTYVLAAVAGVVVGATIATAITYRALTRRYDLNGYDRVRLEATRVRQLHEDADHHQRLATRLGAKAVELRAYVGDLLDTVAEQRDRIAELELDRRRRDVIPAYGAHR